MADSEMGLSTICDDSLYAHGHVVSKHLSQMFLGGVISAGDVCSTSSTFINAATEVRSMLLCSHGSAAAIFPAAGMGTVAAFMQQQSAILTVCSAVPLCRPRAHEQRLLHDRNSTCIHCRDLFEV